MENKKFPILRSCVAMLLKLFLSKGELLSLKGPCEMFFFGGERCAGRKSSLRDVVFNRSTVVYRCQANSSVLDWPSNFK